ncbi:MAG TPA: DUF4395 domain-containing protein [Candidatus Limnocylindria bacterium]|nr:DUF4395 domain-containing protein [Candidatus Limnocylindria bacterium]
MVDSLSPPRLIDPRGHRFGAGLSVALLVLGFLADVSLVIPAVGLALAVSAFVGTRYSALGRPWPLVRHALRIGPPRELESEVPPRFAQLLGTLGLGLASALLLIGVTAGAWLVAAAVTGLQAVLAATGYCLGCRLYFVRWYAPTLFDRIAGKQPAASTSLAR